MIHGQSHAVVGKFQFHHGSIPADAQLDLSGRGSRRYPVKDGVLHQGLQE
jgi:hypothetical protein